MAQIVIDNAARILAAEDLLKLREMIAGFSGKPEELALLVLHELQVMVPRWFDTMDEHLKDSLNRYTELLREQGILGDNIDVVIKGMSVTGGA